MAKCSICGDYTDLPYTCNYCGRKHCSSHRLPEKHNCGTPQPARSPDVAPDGSIKHSTNRNTDQEKTSASNSAFLTILGILLLPFIGGQRLLSGLFTKHGLLICLVGVASAGQLGYAPVPGMPVGGDQVNSALDDAHGLIPNETDTTTADTDSQYQDAETATEDDESSGFFDRKELDRGEIETAIHEEINERRVEHGESRLNFDGRLQQIARGHSKDMAEQGYFSHTSPSGGNFADRYDRAGYDCQVSTGGNRYATGGENIAYTYAYENVNGPNGDTQYYTNEQEIAKGIVNGWMNSSGHRENILKSYWQNEGIGIYIIEVDGKTKVYATQNFC